MKIFYVYRNFTFPNHSYYFSLSHISCCWKKVRVNTVYEIKSERGIEMHM